MGFREFDELARAQHGLISRQQYLQQKSAASLDYLIRVGELTPIFNGIYRLSGAPKTEFQRIMAAVLASPELSVASFTSAAFIHGLPILKRDRPDVTVAGQNSRKVRGISSHFAALSDKEITCLFGIPLTTLERTFVDLAAQLTRGRLVRLIDDSVIDRRTSYQSILDALDFAGSQGRKGSGYLRQLLNERLDVDGDDARSRIQRRIVEAAKLAKLPRPETEWVLWASGHRYQIDVAWPQFRLGAEADGFNVHGTSRVRFDKDRDRHNDIEARNWKLLHFSSKKTKRQIADKLLEVWSEYCV